MIVALAMMACSGPEETDTDQDTDAAATLVELAALDDALCTRWSDGRVSCDTEADDFTHPPDEAFVDIDSSGALGCGLTTAGNVRCFGVGAPAATIPDGSDVADVSVTILHTLCTLTQDGALEHWDANGAAPVVVVGDSDFVDVDGCFGLRAGGSTSESLRHDYIAIAARGGSLLGVGRDGSISTDDVPISTEGRYKAVALGGPDGEEPLTCGLTEAGEPRCWTSDAGWGAGWTISTPIDGDGFDTIAVESRYGCAGRGDGTVECWGDAPL
jgi:hypothetical protein